MIKRVPLFGIPSESSSSSSSSIPSPSSSSSSMNSLGQLNVISTDTAGSAYHRRQSHHCHRPCPLHHLCRPCQCPNISFWLHLRSWSTVKDLRNLSKNKRNNSIIAKRVKYDKYKIIRLFFINWCLPSIELRWSAPFWKKKPQCIKVFTKYENESWYK